MNKFTYNLPVHPIININVIIIGRVIGKDSLILCNAKKYNKPKNVADIMNDMNRRFQFICTGNSQIL